jgi:signal transduction histidine kinase
MSTLGQMLAGIVHEISNPLNYISVAQQNLKDETTDLEDFINALIGDEEEAQKIAEEFKKRFESMYSSITDIAKGIRKVTEINQAIRNYSRLDMDYQDGVNLEKIIDEAIIILFNKIKMHQLEKKYFGLPLISCHQSHLGQVFSNLIGNAADAVRIKKAELEKDGKGGDFNGLIRITGKTEDENKTDGISILVEDNGPGIPDKIKDKITTPFFTTKEVGYGTGLGLSITQKTIEDHGGNLIISSSKDLKGACFKVWLPLKKKKKKKKSKI